MDIELTADTNPFFIPWVLVSGNTTAYITFNITMPIEQTSVYDIVRLGQERKGATNWDSKRNTQFRPRPGHHAMRMVKNRQLMRRW